MGSIEIQIVASFMCPIVRFSQADKQHPGDVSLSGIQARYKTELHRTVRRPNSEAHPVSAGSMSRPGYSRSAIGNGCELAFTEEPDRSTLRMDGDASQAGEGCDEPAVRRLLIQPFQYRNIGIGHLVVTLHASVGNTGQRFAVTGVRKVEAIGDIHG